MNHMNKSNMYQDRYKNLRQDTPENSSTKYKFVSNNIP